MAFKLDSLVELQDQYSNVYPKSPTGARGWVRARRELPQQDPEIFIEWDQSHWRYHGEKDGWTYEHHFRPVQDEVADVEPNNLMEHILSEAKRKVEAERCPHCGEIHDEKDDYISTLSLAQETALGADGFFMVTLTPEHRDGMTIYAPKLFSNALNETAQKMIEAQLVHLATQLFERRMLGEYLNFDDLLP